jgi:hypothetical protein
MLLSAFVDQGRNRLPWLRKGKHLDLLNLPIPAWAKSPSTEQLDVLPDGFDALLSAARHATSVEAGLAISVFAKRPLEAVSYGLMGIEKEYFRSLFRQFYAPADQSEYAVAMRAVSAALIGDFQEAQRRIATAIENGPARSLLAAVVAAADGDHLAAADLATGWIDDLPEQLGPPVAAAAIALILDQRGDVTGRTYWADVLVHLLPGSPAALAFDAECHLLWGLANKNKEALLRAMELRTRTLLARPMHSATRERYLHFAKAIGHGNLSPSDVILERFLRNGGVPPSGSYWELPLGCWCSSVLDLVGSAAEESTVTHLQVIGTAGPIAVARCRHTGASWVLIAKGTLKKEDPARNLRLPHVSFLDLPGPSDRPAPKRGQYL